MRRVVLYEEDVNRTESDCTAIAVSVTSKEATAGGKDVTIDCETIGRSG